MKCRTYFGRLGALLGCLVLAACAVPLQSRQPPSTWTTGFWVWGLGPASTTASIPTLDVVFFQAGTIRREAGSGEAPWLVYATIPANLPAAEEYWAVLRYDRQEVPDATAGAVIAESFERLSQNAIRRHIRLAGIQLDIDCPTSALSKYADFLQEVRQKLPRGTPISITALLDWFKPDTAVGQVIRRVDEFVPQFYDLAAAEGGDVQSGIASKIDSDRWGPVFNGFKKRYRIGISTFGRALLLNGGAGNSHRAMFIRDLTPIDLGSNPMFQLHDSVNAGGELVLNYQAMQEVQVGMVPFKAGDTIRFIVQTPAAVRSAVESARRMQGYSAGWFFRMPGPAEPLVMQAEEVLNASNLTSQPSALPEIRQVDGRCVAVHCVDLYMMNPLPFFERPLRYRIQSSTEFEYFLPEKDVPIQDVGRI